MKKNLLDQRYFYRIVAAVMFFMLVVAVVPLIYIGRYAHPCADDFTYGYYTHSVWADTGSLMQALKWALYQVKSIYDTWQGTFSSVFLMAITPIVWGEQCYVVTPLIMLTMILLPKFYFLHVLLVKLLGASKSIWCIISCVITFCMIENIVSPVNALFWYNGAVHYTFMHGCMLLLFGMVIRMGSSLNKGKNFLAYVAVCIFAVICGGANYSTALLGLLGLVFILIVKFVTGQRRILNWISAVVYGIAFYKNVTAYGNTVRQTNFMKAEPIDAIVNSFVQLFVNMHKWITIPIVLFMLFLIPFWWKAAETDRFRFRLPIVVTILSIGASACMFTPSLYAMSVSGPERLLNIAQMWFYLLLFLNEGYWLGSLRKTLERKNETEWKLKLLPNVRIYTVIILCLVFMEFVINMDGRLLQYSTYAAYVSLRAGEAQQYHQEYMNRLEILNGEETVVELSAFSQKPWLLYFDDITEDSEDWRNMAVAQWYGKEEVYLK